MAGGTEEEVSSAVYNHLAAKHVPPTRQWLQQSFMPSIRLTTPLVAIQKTAEYRLLTTDITTSLAISPSSCFPAGIASPEVKEQRLPGYYPAQVLDVEDIGRSRWSQVEAIEMEERGETKKGSEVIRVVPDDEDNSDPNPPANQKDAVGGPHKLLLQDAKGNKVYGFEMESIEGIKVGMHIGTKLLLKDVVVARGVILLTPGGTEVLGGKVETWDKKWKEDHKKVLKERAGWKEGMGMS